MNLFVLGVLAGLGIAALAALAVGALMLPPKEMVRPPDPH